MNKKLFTIVLVIALIINFLSCVNANESTEQFISIDDLSIESPFVNELRNHFDGGIKFGYIRGKNFTVTTSRSDREFFILKRLNYYAIKDNNKYLLGYVTAQGIFDKNSNLLKGLTDPKPLINLGLSSATLDFPWHPSFAFQDPNWNNEIFNTDAFAFLSVDLINHSLKIHEPNW